MSDLIINKVSESGLITLNLEDHLPTEELMVFDIKPYLFMEQILKEKDFRAHLQQLDWSVYQDKVVAVTCSVDAVIPVWAYMLLVTYLQPIAKDIILGSEEEARKQLFLRNIRSFDVNSLADQRVVIKGCGDHPIGEFAYMEITKLLRPIAKSIMYGEPCSTVPVYKKKN